MVIICLIFNRNQQKGAGMDQIQLSFYQRNSYEKFHSKLKRFFKTTHSEIQFPLYTSKNRQNYFKQSDSRKMLDRLIKRLSGEDIPCRRNVESYLNHKYCRNCKPNTLHSTGIGVIFFHKFLKEAGVADLKNITRGDLEAFIEHEQDRGLKPASVRTRLVIMNAYVNYLIGEGIVHSDVLSRKIRIKLPSLLPRAINPDDLQQFLSTIDDIRNRAIYRIQGRRQFKIILS